MSILSRIFNYVPAKEQKGISLEDNVCWEVTSAKDLSPFLRAIADLVPPQSVLYIEGCSPPKDIQTYLDAHKAVNITKVAMGTIWPRPKCFHMPITTDNIEGFAELTENIATPEAAIHLHVYEGNKILLQWFDAFSDPLYITKEISEDKVKNFCSKLGISYKEYIVRK